MASFQVSFTQRGLRVRSRNAARVPTEGRWRPRSRRAGPATGAPWVAWAGRPGGPGRPQVMRAGRRGTAARTLGCRLPRRDDRKWGALSRRTEPQGRDGGWEAARCRGGGRGDGTIDRGRDGRRRERRCEKAGEDRRHAEIAWDRAGGGDRGRDSPPCYTCDAIGNPDADRIHGASHLQLPRKCWPGLALFRPLIFSGLTSGSAMCTATISQSRHTT